MNEHFDFRDESFSDNEKEIDKQLRPLEFDDFSGQSKIVENLKIFVKAVTKVNSISYSTMMK